MGKKEKKSGNDACTSPKRRVGWKRRDKIQCVPLLRNPISPFPPSFALLPPPLLPYLLWQVRQEPVAVSWHCCLLQQHAQNGHQWSAQRAVSSHFATAVHAPACSSVLDKIGWQPESFGLWCPIC